MPSNTTISYANDIVSTQDNMSHLHTRRAEKRMRLPGNRLQQICLLIGGEDLDQQSWEVRELSRGGGYRFLSPAEADQRWRRETDRAARKHINFVLAVGGASVLCLGCCLVLQPIWASPCFLDHVKHAFKTLSV